MFAPYVRDAEGKRCNTCCNEHQRRHGYPAYRCGSHGVRPLAQSLACQHPRNDLASFRPGHQGPAYWERVSWPPCGDCKAAHQAAGPAPPVTTDKRGVTRLQPPIHDSPRNVGSAAVNARTSRVFVWRVAGYMPPVNAGLSVVDHTG